MKTISFAVPCYNSASYMDACIESLLACGDDIEIIIVNDGSREDNTSEKAHHWQQRYPDIIVAIDQENGGHGAAVERGLAEASGLYFKVVDSDDWLDAGAMEEVMRYLRSQRIAAAPTDMVIANYVYEKVHENKRTVMGYHNVFPVGASFGWADTRRFSPSQYLLMHSVVYRTQLLKDMGLTLPHHCFYVDNLFVYEPLPYVKTMHYLDVDMYRYFIGREGQSINESIMLARIDQQLRITRTMIDAVDLSSANLDPKLRRYMYNYLSMMMCICSVFLRMEPTQENEQKRSDIWNYLKTRKPGMYAPVRASALGLGANLPGPAGRAVCLAGYRLARRLYKFN